MQFGKKLRLNSFLKNKSEKVREGYPHPIGTWYYFYALVDLHMTRRSILETKTG
jgi:hypothetical protein